MSHRARKRFGQNFLVDPAIIRRIVDAIAPEPGQLLFEIGPGQAALSELLADSGAELHLVEIDRDLAAGLQRRFSSRDHVHLHVGDALQMDFGALAGGRPFRLAGNLPYNISTPLLFHVLRWSGSEQDNRVQDLHFMLQQEVVERMAAEPGSKAWGRLSVMCQLRCAVIPLFGVPPEAFQPAPRVHSTVVRLVPHAEPPVRIDDMACFETLLARVFSMRRKTLRNSLRGLLDAASIAAVGIDPGLRPEALGLEQFAALAKQWGQSKGTE